MGSPNPQARNKCSSCPTLRLGLAIILPLCLEFAEPSPEPTTASQPSSPCSRQATERVGSDLAGSHCGLADGPDGFSLPHPTLGRGPGGGHVRSYFGLTAEAFLCVGVPGRVSGQRLQRGL